MADTQKERLERLVEKANFENLEEYETGVALMAEEFKQVANKSGSSKSVVEEKKETRMTISEGDSNNKMKAYLERL
jgi:hypothetical protein